MKKFISVLLFFAFFNFAFGQNKQEKEIKFLTTQLQPMFTDYINNLVKQYEKLHPDIKIKWLDYPSQNYETKLLTMFMSKNSPDIINFNQDTGPNFVLRDYLINLNEYVSDEVKSEYFPNIIKYGCTYRGNFYALPWYLAGSVTMYNTEIFKEAGLDPGKPPKTWDEVKEYSKIIKQKTGKFGFAPSLTESGMLKRYLVWDGVHLIDESGKKAIFNTEEGYKTLEFWANLFKEGLIPRECISATHRREIELYKTGKTAIFITGPQFLHLIKNDAPDIYKATGCASVVLGKGRMFEVAVMNLAISKQTKYPKEAIEFTRFVTNAENQIAFCKIVTILPSIIKAAKDPYFTQVGDSAEDKARMISAEHLAQAIVYEFPRVSQGELDRIMGDCIQKVCLGKSTPKEALDEAAALWTKVLNKEQK